jgi:hypothetical protein
MSRISEIIAVAYAVRHRNEYGHPKAIARARWDRRKKWQTRKNPARSNNGRK